MSATGTASEHGVRHEAPVEMLASAPGGSDSIVKVAVAGLDENAPKLGIHDVFQDEQVASPRLQATTAIARVLFISAGVAECRRRLAPVLTHNNSPRPPRANQYGSWGPQIISPTRQFMHEQMMHEPKPESVAASLTVPERILLFCIGSGTDWQKRPRITGATATLRALSSSTPSGGLRSQWKGAPYLASY